MGFLVRYQHSLLVISTLEKPLRTARMWIWVSVSAHDFGVLTYTLAPVSFTGSEHVGRTVGKTVQSRFGKVLLELGGNNGTHHMERSSSCPSLNTCRSRHHHARCRHGLGTPCRFLWRRRHCRSTLHIDTATVPPQVNRRRVPDQASEILLYRPRWRPPGC